MQEDKCIYCDSFRIALVNSEDGVDVLKCKDCGEWFENDTSIAHPSKQPVKNRKIKFDDE
jgi:transcription elongation factor Elf1